jgi:hypothetical protein
MSGLSSAAVVECRLGSICRFVVVVGLRRGAENKGSQTSGLAGWAGKQWSDHGTAQRSAPIQALRSPRWLEKAR